MRTIEFTFKIELNTRLTREQLYINLQFAAEQLNKFCRKSLVTKSVSVRNFDSYMEKAAACLRCEPWHQMAIIKVIIVDKTIKITFAYSYISAECVLINSHLLKYN